MGIIQKIKALGLATPDTLKTLDAARADLAYHLDKQKAETAQHEDAVKRARELMNAKAADHMQATAVSEIVRAGVQLENRAHSVASAEQRLAALEAKALTEVDAATRKQTADTIEGHLVAKGLWNRDLIALLHRGRPLLEMSQLIDGVDSTSLCAALYNLAEPEELPAAFERQSLRMRQRIEATLSGRAPASLTPVKPAKPVTHKPVLPAVASYSALNPFIFTSVIDGKRQSINRGGNADLSPAQAQLAIERRLVEPFDILRSGRRSTAKPAARQYLSLICSTISTPIAHLIAHLRRCTSRRRAALTGPSRRRKGSKRCPVGYRKPRRGRNCPLRLAQHQQRKVVPNEQQQRRRRRQSVD